MSVKFVDRARMTTATTGTGTITLNTPAPAFQSFAAAGIGDADNIRYLIEDGAAWEIGTGVYGSSGATLTRSLLSSSSGSLLTLSGSAVVSAIAAATDITKLGDAVTYADLTGLPTSSVGLSAGDLYWNGDAAGGYFLARKGTL